METSTQAKDGDISKILGVWCNENGCQFFLIKKFKNMGNENQSLYIF